MKLTIIGCAFSPDFPPDGDGHRRDELSIRVEVEVANDRLVGVFTDVARPDVPVPFDIDADLWRTATAPLRAALAAD